MPPVVNLIAGIILIPAALLVGWDASVTGSAPKTFLTVVFLATSALQFVTCGILRARGCGWTERPRTQRHSREDR